MNRLSFSVLAWLTMAEAIAAPAEKPKAPEPAPLSADEQASIIARRPMNDWFPAFDRSCQRGVFDPPVAMPGTGNRLMSLTLVRGPDELAWERKHEMGDLIPSVGLRVQATFQTPKARTLTVFTICETQSEGPLRCIAQSCFRGLMTLTPDGLDAVRVTVGGQIGGTFVPDYFDLTTQCPANAVPMALESGDRPLSLRLTRVPPEQCP